MHEYVCSYGGVFRVCCWVYSPVLLLSSLTFRVITVDDGLLRTSTGCTNPSPSLTLYVDSLKLIVIAVIVNHI